MHGLCTELVCTSLACVTGDAHTQHTLNMHNNTRWLCACGCCGLRGCRRVWVSTMYTENGIYYGASRSLQKIMGSAKICPLARRACDFSICSGPIIFSLAPGQRATVNFDPWGVKYGTAGLCRHLESEGQGSWDKTGFIASLRCPAYSCDHLMETLKRGVYTAPSCSRVNSRNPNRPHLFERES